MRMPETLDQMTNPGLEPEADDADTSFRSRTTVFSTGYAKDENSSATSAGSRKEQGLSPDPELPLFRINWELKALVPIACVLLGGMLLFLLATLSWRDPERHIVLLVA